MNRKRSLSSHLSRKTPDDNEFAEAISELIHGSDRVAAIMCSALVEHELISAISAAIDDASETSVLFHSGEASPFGTFKQRIAAGRALGIFGPGVVADLDTIRDIRNQFAHALIKLDFENEHIVRSCSELGDYIAWAEVADR